MSSLRHRESGYPRDLRDEGRPDDPLFNSPLVYGRIADGVVEVRRPGSDEKERFEVGTGRKREVGSSQMNMVETKAVNGTTTGEVSPRLSIVAELYNAGETWESMVQKLGISDSTLGKYIRRARKAGLITVVRERGRRPSGGSGDASAHPESEDVDGLLRRMVQLEERVEILQSNRSTPGPGITVLEDLSRELEAVKKELDIVVTGLAELTKRIRALEEQPPRVAVDPVNADIARELVKLLELAITREGRRIA